MTTSTRALPCLAALALALGGCFDFDRLRQPRDGGAAAGNPTPRLIAQAWFSDATGAIFATPGTNKTGFEIATTGIVDGDLVLFVGAIDNGSDTVWPNPIAPGFTQLAQSFYGNDGQTFVVAYKVAAGEPAKYSGTYGPGVNSASSAIALIAVAGANRVMPIDNSLATFSSAAGASPVVGSSPGFVTTAASCTLLLASGADWLGAVGTNTWTLPSGFMSLSQLGDHGNAQWDWTSQQVSWAKQPMAGPTGPISWSATGSQTGQPWTVLVAVAP